MNIERVAPTSAVSRASRTSRTRTATLARKQKRAMAAASAVLALLGCGDLLEHEALRHLWPGGHGSGDELGGHGHGGHRTQRPLTLVDIDPADLSSGVDTGAAFTLTFSAALDPASSLTAFDVTRGSALPGSVAVQGRAITFTPARALALDAAYTLRFDGDVRALRGAEWESDVEVSFQTRGGAWGSPERVAIAGDSPEVAMGADGTAVLIWEVPAAQVAARVALAEHTFDAGWQAFPISGTTGGPFSVPVRVVAGDGAFMLLWHSIGILRNAVYRPGGDLGTIDSSFSRGANHDGDGALAGGHGWVSVNEFNILVTLRHTTDGTTWESLPNVYLDETVLVQGGPRIVTDAAGNAKAFWITDAGLLVSTFTSGSPPDAWSAPTLLATRDAASDVGAVVAGGSALGDAWIAWEEALEAATATTRSLRLVHLASDGSVDESVPDSLAALGDASSPALAVNAAGDALLSWIETSSTITDAGAADAGAANDDTAHARAAFRSAGAAAWSPSLPLSSTAGAQARAPAVALDPSGNGHAVWLEAVASGAAQLIAARFEPATGELEGTAPISGAATPVFAPPQGNVHTDPRVVVDDSGRAIAIWVGNDGAIWSARFE